MPMHHSGTWTIVNVTSIRQEQNAEAEVGASRWQERYSVCFRRGLGSSIRSLHS